MYLCDLAILCLLFEVYRFEERNRIDGVEVALFTVCRENHDSLGARVVSDFHFVFDEEFAEFGEKFVHD